MSIKLFLKKKTNLFVLFLMAASLVSCSSDGEERADYAGADTVKSLEIPPRLTIPDTRGALRLPEPSKEALQEQSGTAESSVIAPTFKGFVLKNESRLYWLEIDQPVAAVWKSLPGFFAAEGIKLDRAEKLLGFVDTQWMEEYKQTYSDESGNWFGSFSADYKDRFRIRIEAQGENKTRLYVSHRGLQISVANDVSEWTQRESEPLLEREILYRYVLFAGIAESGAKELLAAYSSYQPRVEAPEGATNEFEVKGEADVIWLRLQVAMDRLGVDILKSDKATGSMTVLVGHIKIDEKPPENDSGWFGGLFSGKDIVVDEYDGYENGDYKEQPDEVAIEDRKTLQVKQTASEFSSVIAIYNEDGSAISSGLSMLFRDVLVKQLK